MKRTLGTQVHAGADRGTVIQLDGDLTLIEWGPGVRSWYTPAQLEHLDRAVEATSTIAASIRSLAEQLADVLAWQPVRS